MNTYIFKTKDQYILVRELSLELARELVDPEAEYFKTIPEGTEAIYLDIK